MRLWFKEAREKKKMTQQEIANKIGVTRQFIGMIENGRATPRPEKAKIIANLLEFDWTMFYEKISA